MKCEYDRKTDILVIRLSDDEPASMEQAEDVITHYTKDGTPVQVVLLHASRTAAEILRPMLQQQRLVRA